jgi:GT2 family glycosyltransferase
MRIASEPNLAALGVELLHPGGDIRLLGAPRKIECIQPHMRLVSDEVDLPAGMYWLHCAYSATDILFPPRLGIICQTTYETHVIGVDLDRKDRLIKLVGGRVRFELTPFASAGTLLIETLVLRPMSGARWLSLSLRRGLGKVFPSTGLNKIIGSTQAALPELEAETARETETTWRAHDAGFFSLSPQGHRLLSETEHLVARVFAKQSEAIAVYGDSLAGAYVRALPDWDPTLAAAIDYVDGPVFIRDSASDLCLATGMEALKAAEHKFGSTAICHIPAPLSHAAEKDHNRARLNIPCPDRPHWPSVSIVIPTKIRLDLLALCLAGLAKQTDYPSRLDIIIVDNGADARELKSVIADAQPTLDIRVIDRSGPFNFSYLVNQGVAEARGEVVVLLNDDVVPIEPSWLKRMVDSVMDARVGAVGARLLNKNGTIQHAGVALGLCGLCGHMWRGLSDVEAQNYPSILAPSRRSAVTGACLAVRKSLYLEAGGFDERDLQVTLNDIDFCLRLNGLGYQTLYRGDAVLIHDESSSRGADTDIAKLKRRAAEIEKFQVKWHLRDYQDPYFSLYFDRYSESGIDPFQPRPLTG